MISLMVVDASDYLAAKRLNPLLIQKEKEVFEKAGLAGDKKSKTDTYTSLAAYLSLEYFLKKCGKEMPNITRGENGKPEFVPCTERMPEFNVSHSKGVCLIAINSEKTCKGVKIGVDIEQNRHVLHQEGIQDRYLQNVNNYLQNTSLDNINLKVYSLSTQTLEPQELSGHATIAPVDGSGFFDRWCTMEAVLKADGRGFKSIKNFDALFRASKLSVFSLNLNSQIYTCALAVL